MTSLRDTLARRHARSQEWLEEVAPFLPRGAAIERALSRLREPEIFVAAAPASDAGLPASGQTSTYLAVRRGSPQPVQVPDDGAIRAGEGARYRDNGDGTISDLVTGLVWEKKCDGCGGLHDAGARYAWAAAGNEPSVATWLAALNAEHDRGFAGYGDWRIPRAEELIGIVSYETFNPAVTSAFDAKKCGLGCSDLIDPDCSCTSLSAYWTSTPLAAQSPSMLLTVGFHLGLVSDSDATEGAHVRAVRDATIEAATGANGSR